MAPLGASGYPKWRPKGVRTAPSGVGQGRRKVILMSFGRLYSKSCYFLKYTQKNDENLSVSRVREGPGAQVGATWAPKSHPRGVRTAKNRVGRGKVVPNESCCLSELWSGTGRDGTGREGTQRDRLSDHVGSQSLSKRSVI